MKKVFGALLMLGLTVGVANAATLSIEWAPSEIDQAGESASLAKLPASGVGTYQQFVNMLPGDDNYVGGGFQYDPVSQGDFIQIVDQTMGGAVSNQAGWGVVAVGGYLGQPAPRVAAASLDPLNNSLSGPGNYMIATFQFSVDPGTPDDTYNITIHHDNVTFLHSDGTSFPYEGEYGSVYSGYYNYGIGSPLVPAAKKIHGQAANPLQIEVPEPASLALLAIGGVALLRRRN